MLLCNSSGVGLGWNARLLQKPELDLVVPHTEQVERSAPIVFLGERGRLMPLNLRDNADRHFDPLRQCPERAAKTM